MKYQDWAELRAHAIDRFNGDTPHPHTEQTIIDAYQAHPEAVEREIATVADALATGNIRSGWGILAKRAERISAPPTNPAATSTNREQALARAEQRIRTTGPHINRETELLDDLFGDFGMFKDYEPTDDDRERLLALWRGPVEESRQKLEAELEKRDAAWNSLHTCPKCGRRFPGTHCRGCLPKDVAATLAAAAPAANP